jgi:creatinine amidohydrolase
MIRLALLGLLLTAGAARAADSVWLEELTSPELKARVEAGARTVLIPTGGVEQGGPHLALGKHNRIIAFAATAIAQRLGQTLVAPLIPIVPEGVIEPPSGNMLFAGTLSLPEPVFEAVLENVARSLKRHGFTRLVFLGDHGWSQKAQDKIARKLGAEWRKDGVKVLNADDFHKAGDAQETWLKERGFAAAQIGEHGGIRDTSELMRVAPQAVREERRAPAGAWRQSGHDGDPSQASEEIGDVMIEIKIKAALDQLGPFR